MPVARLPRVHVPRLPMPKVPWLPGVGEVLDSMRGRRGPAWQRDSGHPSDPSQLLVEAVGLGAYVASLPVGLAGLVIRRAPIPVEASAFISLAENEPRIRRVLQARFGRIPTDIGVTIASAGVQALAFGPLGIIGGIAHHGAQLADLTARRSAWLRRAPDWNGERAPGSPPPDAGPRPEEMRPGPIERYSTIAETAALGLGGIAVFTPASRRASALAVAALPRAAQIGRDAFCARLGRGLAERDVVVLDREAIWRLDRVDTIVIDARALATDGEPASGAEDLLRAAGDAHAAVVLAGEPPAGVPLPEEAQRRGADGVARTMRELQGEGGCVLVVSARDERALAAGDVGVGIVGPDRVPWSADVLAGPDLDDAALLIEASGAARAVSERSVQIAAGASGIGGLLAITRRGARAPQVARTTVNLATLGVFGWASSRGNDVARRPRPLRGDTTPWHELDAERALDRLETRSDGLAGDEATIRQDGECQPDQTPSGLGFERALAEEVANPLTPVMAAGAGVSAAIGSVVDAVMVGSVLAANALVGAAQRMHTDRMLSRLEEGETQDVSVLRDGEVVNLRVDDLVTGDVLVLETGAVIPADARLIQADALEVDESNLTGESFPISKSVEPTDASEVADRRSMVYAGTSVSAGSGRAAVVATGPMTEANRSMHQVGASSASAVESRLDRLTGLITPIALGSAGLVVGAGLLRGRSLQQTLGSAVGLAVASVPEGLPFVSTVAELAAARRLSERNALIRDPKTVEALGRVDVLCFDKTGTLTEGQIELQRVTDGDVDESVDELSDRGRALLGAALRASPLGNGDEPIAHATDHAVVQAGQRAQVDAEVGLPHWRPIADLPFEPERGFHAVRGDADDRALVCVKGAPEVLLERCKSWRRGEAVVSLEDGERQAVEEVVDRVASNGYRVLAVAQRDASTRDELLEDDVDDLELLGFVALADSIRETAAEAVATARRAGIGVIMITGDHPATAEAVARELGADNGRVLVGSDLEQMSEDELAEAAEGAVFARVTPAHKVQIVEALQRSGRVVAMTGDGANDAPAIRLADVGMALGRRGTPAARDAADVVITDDALETIIEAIVEGRAVWASVRDALGVLVGGNLGEIGFTVATTAATGVSALGPRQILLVNMLTDLLPAMAIAVRPPVDRSPERLLSEGPESSLKEALTADIVLRGTTTAAGATAAWLAARVTGRGRRASTVGLLALVGTQLGQTLVTGGGSASVIATVAGSSALLAATVQTPGVSQFFGCTPVGPIGFGIAVGSSAAATGASVLLRPVAERFLPSGEK